MKSFRDSNDRLRYVIFVKRLHEDSLHLFAIYQIRNKIRPRIFFGVFLDDGQQTQAIPFDTEPDKCSR